MPERHYMVWIDDPSALSSYLVRDVSAANDVAAERKAAKWIASHLRTRCDPAFAFSYVLADGSRLPVMTPSPAQLHVSIILDRLDPGLVPDG